MATLISLNIPHLKPLVGILMDAVEKNGRPISRFIKPTDLIVEGDHIVYMDAEGHKEKFENLTPAALDNGMRVAVKELNQGDGTGLLDLRGDNARQLSIKMRMAQESWINWMASF